MNGRRQNISMLTRYKAETCVLMCMRGEVAKLFDRMFHDYGSI